MRVIRETHNAMDPGILTDSGKAETHVLREDAESSRARDSMEEPSGPCNNTRHVMSMEPGIMPGLALAVKFTRGSGGLGLLD